MASTYRNYMSYVPPQYYGMPPQYNNGAMPSQAPYQTYGRSPPPMRQYAPMMGVSVPQSYARHYEQFPSLATSYQPPPTPASVPIHPRTPSSTHSSTLIPPSTPIRQGVDRASCQLALPPAESPVLSERPPFRPPLPWFSRPDLVFPKRQLRSRLKRTSRSRLKKIRLSPNGEAVSFPEQPGAAVEHECADVSAHAVSSDVSSVNDNDKTPVKAPTVSTNEAGLNKYTSPQSPIQESAVRTDDNVADHTINGDADVKQSEKLTAQKADVLSESAASTTPVKVAPSSWAKLFSPPASQNTPHLNGVDSVSAGKGSENAASIAASGSNFSLAHKSSLTEVIRNFRVDSIYRASLIEPRGLINTGNMCYMNSVLQVLVFCAPFYNFLEQLGQKAAHSFESETPLLDVLVVFMQEFKVLASANTPDQLRHSVRTETFERHGDPFTTKFVYDAIRQLPRFASMEHGHQQDAEEFLGFILQTLDDECAHLMSKPLNGESKKTGSDAPTAQAGPEMSGGWLEVGRKQKAAVTRSSGSSSSTPITKIFGGLLRSELRVPGLKDSITTEPYQPLQLDIGSPDVRNVVDALRGLTQPERLQGDFNSARGKGVTATKQVFIESLPPVLILHLKRFQFDAEGHGTIKIWKKVGYPLELEIPREALSRQRRQVIGDGPMPRYKLISVVYHHGKKASGGHYTADVRRQDSREWIRMDDTVLRRIPGEEVAKIGSEEDVKDIHRDGSPTSGASTNRFSVMDEDETGDEDGWKQVTAPNSGNKKPINSANSTKKAGSEKKKAKNNTKDNKVAYLLFYQRV